MKPDSARGLLEDAIKLLQDLRLQLHREKGNETAKQIRFRYKYPNPILALERAKRLFPQLRIGQIIGNAADASGNMRDSYYVSDEDLARSIESYCDTFGSRKQPPGPRQDTHPDGSIPA